MYLLKIKSFGRVNFTTNIVHVINLESIVLPRQLLITSLNSKVGYLRVKTNNLIHLESKSTSVKKIIIIKPAVLKVQYLDHMK